MSDVIEAATAHFSNLIDVEPECIEVPEWSVNGAPAKIYFKPTLNVAEKGKLIALYNEGKHYEMMIMAIILKATNESGDKLFTEHNSWDFEKRVSAEVVENIFARMNLFRVDEEGVEKK